MSVTVRPDTAKRDYSGAIADLVKAIAAAGMTAFTADTITAGQAIAAAVPRLIDMTLALTKRKDIPLGATVWTLIRAAYVASLTRFLGNAELARRPKGKELETLVASLLQRIDILADQSPQVISADCLQSPLKIAVLRDAASQIPHELKPFNPKMSPTELRKKFESNLFEGLADVRDRQPDEFRKLEDSLSGPLSLEIDRRKAKVRHHE
ncbi:hypothetical protein [Dongia deserti]|uniref:hypothetical protein n=1 Tax=Dongia deserti TaxID=2268030 RepID=UPI0013C3FFAA|nr:hypothetical protein [Dongia deserti]